MKNAMKDKPMYKKAVVLKDRLIGMVGAYLPINQCNED
jgi:hypothetical protein